MNSGREVERSCRCCASNKEIMIFIKQRIQKQRGKKKAPVIKLMLLICCREKYYFFFPFAGPAFAAFAAS